MTMNVNAGYQFAEIPNDTEGQQMVRLMRKHLNPRFIMRVRGQGLNAEGKALGWKKFTYGAPLKYSSHLRIYIEERFKP